MILITKFRHCTICLTLETVTISRSADQYAVSVVANQTSGRNIFKGLLLMAREVTCASNSTIRGKRQFLIYFLSYILAVS